MCAMDGSSVKNVIRDIDCLRDIPILACISTQGQRGSRYHASVGRIGAESLALASQQKAQLHEEFGV